MNEHLSNGPEQSQEPQEPTLEVPGTDFHYLELTLEQEEEIDRLVQTNSSANYRQAIYRVTGYLATNNEVEVTAKQEAASEPTARPKSKKRTRRSDKKRPHPPLKPHERAHIDVSREAVKRKPFPYGWENED